MKTKLLFFSVNMFNVQFAAPKFAISRAKLPKQQHSNFFLILFGLFSILRPSALTSEAPIMQAKKSLKNLPPKVGFAQVCNLLGRNVTAATF